MASDRWKAEARAVADSDWTQPVPHHDCDCTSEESMRRLTERIAAFAREVEARVWEEAIQVSESQTQLSIVRERLRQRAARAREGQGND